MASVKDPAKYPSANPIKTETTIAIKNRFDGRISKNQGLFGGSSTRVTIELLDDNGYEEPGNAGLYYFNGTCGITSSDPTITPGITFLDYNGYPLSTSGERIPGSRFKLTGLEKASAGSKVDILCTLTDTKTGTLRNFSMTETK